MWIELSTPVSRHTAIGGHRYGPRRPGPALIRVLDGEAECPAAAKNTPPAINQATVRMPALEHGVGGRVGRMLELFPNLDGRNPAKGRYRASQQSGQPGSDNPVGDVA